jgi:hypothetical protein
MRPTRDFAFGQILLFASGEDLRCEHRHDGGLTWRSLLGNGTGTRMPQQLPLIVQHVSCIVTVTAGTVRFARLATRKGDTAPYTMTQLLPASNDGAAWVISSPVVHLLKSGERPHLIFSNSENANWQIECNVSGQLQQSWQQPPHTSALMGRRWG